MRYANHSRCVIWIVLFVVAVAGFCVYRLRGFFGAHDSSAMAGGVPEELKPFNPKHVVYEVSGPPGDGGEHQLPGHQRHAAARGQRCRCRWTLSVTTTLPSVSVNVVAQGDSDEIGCRIIVNDVVKDERSTTGVNAQTFCIVKSA